MNESAFPNLLRDAEKVSGLLTARHAPMKIVLKTRDDTYFLQEWLDYHARIVGAENLIIIDNLSVEPSVLLTLERAAQTSTVLSYKYFHNLIHYTDQIPGFYEALRASCDYYVFLDTDEFLTLILDDVVRSPSEIVPYIRQHAQTQVFPGTWLMDIWKSREIFDVSNEALIEGLRWGKPVLKSDLQVEGYLNHNANLPQAVFESVNKNLFVRHFSRLYPAQRIRANMRKLVSRGVAEEGEPLENIIARNRGSEDPVVPLYLEEISEALEVMDKEPDHVLQPDCLRMKADRPLEFYSDQEAQRFADFLSDPDGSVVAALLETCREPNP